MSEELFFYYIFFFYCAFIQQGRIQLIKVSVMTHIMLQTCISLTVLFKFLSVRET